MTAEGLKQDKPVFFAIACRGMGSGGDGGCGRCFLNVDLSGLLYKHHVILSC